MPVLQTAARKRQEDDVLSDSAVGISVVEADTYSAGKERASTSVTAVVVNVAGGGRVSLHVTDAGPVSKRKVVHARRVVNKARRIDLCTHFRLRLQTMYVSISFISILLIGCRLL